MTYRGEHMKKRFVLGLVLLVFSVLVACNIDNVHVKVSGTTEKAELQGENEKNVSVENDLQDNIEEEKNNIKNVDVIISDENFITDMDEVFNNIDDYIGKTMKVEGFIGSIDGDNFKVLRLYDMAHDDHSHEVTVGVNAIYDGEVPAEDTWVEIIGVIIKEVVDGREQPVIKVSRLEKKFTHGKTKVYN